ncbi:MerR family transcriptional regulator [Acetobacterium bakii]|uniref:MerR family transcriptional regulator n=1 Tax=Acetobacterium bakii TaxID=52689 RepID=A0A0L6TWP9_9FIRM|nr:MerR family transcriptional regulator [Acetobacterium bakii]KNZ40492.1 MerR family transcriptional regulator [Acetobacterium bakii]
MYRIGLFSKICKITVKTLRYYDEVGLVTPAFIDAENGYRYYTNDQLVIVHQVVSLRQMGFSIDEISAMLKHENVDGILEQRKSELVGQLKNVKDQLSRINHFILEKKEGQKMNYQAVIKELPECIVYSKRMVIPNYDAYFKLVPAIGEEVKKANPTLKCAVPEYCFIIYHDGEYKETNIDVEYCEAVTEWGTETDNIKFKKMPSISAVSVMHKGAYDTLGNAYAYVFKWIEENGYIATDSPRESYIDGIWNKENKEDWLTEVQVPVKKK